MLTPKTALMKGFAFPRQSQSGGSDKNSTPSKLTWHLVSYTVHPPDIALLQRVALDHNGKTSIQCIVSTLINLAIEADYCAQSLVRQKFSSIVRDSRVPTLGEQF